MNMRKRFLAFLAFLAAVLLLAIMQTTTPSTVSPLTIVVVFILLYSLLACVLALSFFFVYRIFCKFVHRDLKTTHHTPGSGEVLTYCAIVALGPVVIVAMRSIGHVQSYTPVLVVLFIFCAILYVRRQM